MFQSDDIYFFEEYEIEDEEDKNIISIISEDKVIITNHIFLGEN